MSGRWTRDITLLAIITHPGLSVKREFGRKRPTEAGFGKSAAVRGWVQRFVRTCIHSRMMQAGQGIFPPCKAKNRSNTWCIARFFPGAKSRLRRLRLDAPAGAVTRQGGKRPGLTASDGCEYRFYSNHQNWRHTAGRGAFSAAEAPKTQEALMAFKFLGQRQLGKLPSRWVSTILMVAIKACPFAA